MGRVSWRDRARYAFDNFMSRGTGALVIGLLVVSVAFTGAVAAFVTLTGGAVDEGLSFTAALWRSLMRTINYGGIERETGDPSFIAAMLLVALFGIVVTTALISIVTSGLQARLQQLRKGRSRVIERDHTVILGWSQQVHTILAELVEANAHRRQRTIVVLAERDPVEMEDEVRSRLGPRGARSTRIVFRTGSPLDVGDLAIASVETSRSVVILAPEVEDPDQEVIKSILAIVNHPGRRQEPYHIVAAIQDAANLAVAQMVGRDEVELMRPDDVIARIAAQTCRQSGLSVVYQELLDFTGDEIYVAEPGELVGRSWMEALVAFSDASPIGILPGDGKPIVNPSSDRTIGSGDRLIVIAADERRITPRSGPAPRVDESLISRSALQPLVAERTLILGWNRRASILLRELDRYAPKGSKVMVVAGSKAAETDVERLAPKLRQKVSAKVADSASRRVLDKLKVETYDHIVVLCDSDELDVARADARTLITLLHLRDIASRGGRTFSIVSEMLDLRDRALAEVARADDFIVSDRLISLMIAQVAETKHLGAVFEELLNADGAEISLKPAGDYVLLDRPVPYLAVVEAARRRGETAIGYRVASEAERADLSYGLHLNPPKDDEATFVPSDRVVVLAES